MADKKFTFPIGKVAISLIQKKYSDVIKDDNEKDRYTGTMSSIRVPQNIVTGELVDPLTREEREAIEEALSYEPGTLSIHKAPENNFYMTKKAQILMVKSDSNPASMDRILDKSNPYEYLLYKIAMVSPITAKDWDTRFEYEDYQYVIKDLDVEEKEELSWSAKEDQVFEYILNNKTNKKKLYDLLRIVGLEKSSVSVSVDSSVEWMAMELKKLAKLSKSNLQLIYTIINSNQEEMACKVLLLDGISTGLIKKTGTIYKRKDGSVLGTTEADAIAELNKDENQDLRLLIAEFQKKKK